MRAAGKIKSFLIQQFFKNVGEVWASSPHLRSKSNCIMKWNKNLRTNRKNRNCLQIKKVVMKDKVSGAIAIPKASWGCAPALPNRIRMVFLGEVFPITSRRQTKSFSVQQFFKNAAEVWASSPHLRSKFNFAICFPCCNCIFWNCQIRNFMICMKQVANSDKATGQLQHAGRQKQGWNPLLPDAKDRFL